MPAIALRLTAAQAMTNTQRKLARRALASVGLIEPARFTAPGGNVWLVFDDHRIDLRDVAYFGAFARRLADLPPGYDPPDSLDDATAAEARAWLRDKLDDLVVWPVTAPEGEDPWMYVLGEQDAPASVAAGAGVPDNWTPADA